MSISLAVKYRPKTFDDVSEQGSVKAILENQISTNTIKHGYLFAGGAGTGKTTCARIFANEINKGQGEPIELDAASNNSVEDIRRLTEQAQTKSLDSEFKVFIIDECFPSNTLISTEVGLMPIKDIEPGIRVKSMTGLNKVTHIFKNSVLTERLCCVTINNKKMVTTVDHLFFTNNGWVKAIDLTKGDVVYGTASMQKLWKDISRKGGTELCSEVLLPRMFGNLSREKSSEENEGSNLSDLWETDDNSKLFLEENLFKSLQICSNIETQYSDSEYRIWDDATETIIRKNVEIKSLTQSQSDRKSSQNEREKWHTSSMEGRAGWKREVHNTTDSLVRSLRKWMDFGISDTNGIQSETGKRNVSYLLQSRPRLSPNEACNRGGWCKPQLEKWVVERCKENSFVGNFRVESVEVYKRGYNDKLFLGSFTDTELSKDYVELFDIEVENDHCYFANDILVHNCHSLSNQAWQAMLKTLEEPPASSIFIFCTTNPEKIPNTILSRVQRYNFQRISQKGIVSRLKLIIDCENQDHVQPFEKHTEKPDDWIDYDIASLEYIAKIADGGMRDAITLMDKCLSYSKELSVANVEEALGLVDYQLMYDLTMKAKQADVPGVIEIINGVYASGVDLKLFVKNYFEFVLDFNVFLVTNSLDATKIPKTFESKIKTLGGYFTIDSANELLDFLVDLQSKIKWEQAPKAVILAGFMLYMGEC